MQLLLRFFWIAIILAIGLNAVTWWRKSQAHRERDPTLTAGYRKLLRGFVVGTSIPFLVMGAGILFCGVPSMLSYFRPGDGDPFVLAFFVSLGVLLLAGTFWIFAARGATQVADHPRVFGYALDSPAKVRAAWSLVLASNVIATAMMFSGRFDDAVPPSEPPPTDAEPSPR